MGFQRLVFAGEALRNDPGILVKRRRAVIRSNDVQGSRDEGGSMMRDKNRLDSSRPSCTKMAVVFQLS